MQDFKLIFVLYLNTYINIGTYTFSYDDGKIETKVQKSRIRYEFRNQEEGVKSPKTYWGWEVEWRAKDGKFIKGRVVAESDDGEVYVKYGTGDNVKVVTVTKKDIKPLNPPISQPKPHASDNYINTTSDSGKNMVYTAGDKVEIFDAKKDKWFFGKISMVRTNGTYDVECNNTTYDRISNEIIRPIGSKDNDMKTRSLNNDNGNNKTLVKNYWGPKVEVRQNNGQKWIIGRVTGENDDERFEITYDDNTKELVGKDDIRLYKETKSHSGHKRNHPSSPKAQQSASKQQIEFKKGDKVEVDFLGKGKWLAGQIMMVRSDGTYDVELLDGDFENRIQIDRIRSIGSNSGSGANSRNIDIRSPSPMNTDSDYTNVDSFKVGQHIRADYKGEGKYYKGRIIAMKSNNKCNVEYDDGEIENNIPYSRIRPFSSTNGAKIAPSPTNNDGPKRNKTFTNKVTDRVDHYYGPKVQANHHGQGKWRVARVTGETRNGEFEVTYDHNNEVEIVTKTEIKPLGRSYSMSYILIFVIFINSSSDSNNI